MQPRIPLAFQAARAHCRLASSFSSTRSPKFFTTGLPSRSSPCCCVNCTAQLGVVCNHAERALDAVIYVLDKGVEEHRCQGGALGDTTRDRPPPTRRTVDHNPLAAISQPLCNPSNGPPFKRTPLQFREKDVVRDHVKGFAEVQIDDIHHPSSKLSLHHRRPPDWSGKICPR